VSFVYEIWERGEGGDLKLFGLAVAVKDDFTTEYSLFKDNNSGFLTDRTCGFLTDRTVVFLLTVSSLKSHLMWLNPVSRCHRLMKKKNKNINDD